MADQTLDDVADGPAAAAPLSFDFTLAREEFPFTIDGQPYKLREIDGKARDGYLNNLAARVKTDAAGKSLGVRNFDGLQANLLARCVVDAAGKLVGETVIQSWPARILEALYKKAREMNALGEDKTADGQNKAEADAKND